MGAHDRERILLERIPNADPVSLLRLPRQLPSARPRPPLEPGGPVQVVWQQPAHSRASADSTLLRFREQRALVFLLLLLLQLLRLPLQQLQRLPCCRQLVTRSPPHRCRRTCAVAAVAAANGPVSKGRRELSSATATRCHTFIPMYGARFGPGPTGRPTGPRLDTARRLARRRAAAAAAAAAAANARAAFVCAVLLSLLLVLFLTIIIIVIIIIIIVDDDDSEE